MTLQQLHHGGFLWELARGERDSALRRVIAEVGQAIVVTTSDAEANELSRRLVVSGVPVVVGETGSDSAASEQYVTDGRSTLIATDSYLHANSGLETGVLVHARVSNSVRQYSRRMNDVAAAVHLSFAFPEDHKSATILASHLDNPAVDADLDLTSALDTTVDLTDREPVRANRTRLRLPLKR